MFNSYPDILSVKQLCEILCIGKNTAYRLLQSGEIRSIKISGYKGIAKNHIVPFFSKMRVLLVDITPQHIQEYYNTKVKEGLSPGSVQRHHSLIRKALQNAVLKDVILFNPADKTQRPRQTKYRPSIYDAKIMP